MVFQRLSLLEALAQVQAPLEELNQLTSLTSVQTKGLKRHFAEVKSGSGDITAQHAQNEKVCCLFFSYWQCFLSFTFA